VEFSTYLTSHFTYGVKTRYRSRRTIQIFSHRFMIKPCFHNAFSVWPIHVPHGSHLLICISLFPFLGSLTQSRKAPTSFSMSVRPPACPSFVMYQRRLPPGVLPSKLILETFMKICRQNQNLAQMGHFRDDLNTFGCYRRHLIDIKAPSYHAVRTAEKGIFRERATTSRYTYIVGVIQRSSMATLV
jgi:hypothetical protein